MRRLFMVLLGVCMMTGLAQADTLRLKNGNVVEGKILEKNADGIKMEVSGVILTYYTDEITSVEPAEGSAAPVAVPAATIPAAAAEVSPAAVAVVPAPAAAPAAAGSTDPLASMSKKDLIIKFVAIYGVKENMQANFDKMMVDLKPDQVQAFRSAVKVDDIIEQILPIYDKYFSEEDLRAYIRFYTSESGKKFSQTMPVLVQDSVNVSVKYLEAHLPESLK